MNLFMPRKAARPGVEKPSAISSRIFFSVGVIDFIVLTSLNYLGKIDDWANPAIFQMVHSLTHLLQSDTL